MLEAAVMVKVTVFPDPEIGTLPVPVQPVTTYWVPEGPGVGDVTDSVTLEPESNQPPIGEGES
jgi:hypothetical protein